MKKQDKYDVKDVVILDDDKEYSIIKKVDNYFVFMSLEQPLTIFVGTLENDVIKLVDDKDTIIKVLSD